ncbi:flagellar basal body-associated FliL family protein [Roseivivax halodurans]|nr:flagellar basal body-associated FliL family protein [Roseivivax halodurans]
MEATEDQKGGKSPLHKAGIAGVLFVVCLAAAAGGMALSMGSAAFLSVFDASATGDADADPETSRSTAQGETSAAFEMLPVDEMIVNITALTLSGRITSRFLKIDAVILYDPEIAGADEISARYLYIRDSFQDYMRQLGESDLEGSAGLARLKSELLRRARAVSGSDAPREILIADMVIQ